MRIISIITCFVFSTSTFAQTAEQKAVKASFDNYKKSILNDKGEEAVNFVDNKTIAYYSGILEKVKHADSATVDNLSILDKLMVFSIRHRTTKDKIMQMDGRGLIVFAINSGMVGKNSVANNEIGEVTINKNQAKGQMLVRGQKTPLFMEFNKESADWKADLTSLFPISITAFKKMAEDSGETENDFLFTILQTITGKEVSEDVWKPLAL